MPLTLLSTSIEVILFIALSLGFTLIIVKYFIWRQMKVNTSEHAYKLIFEESPLPMWIIDNSNQLILDTNDAFSLLYGYTKKELMQLSASDLWHSTMPMETDISRYIHEEMKTQSVHKKKDGSKIFVEVKACLINFRGRQCTLLMNNDITERIRIDKILHDSEINLRALINNTADAIGSIDKNGTIIIINKRFEYIHQMLYGVKPHLGMNIFKYFSKEAHDIIYPLFERSLMGEKVRFERTYILNNEQFFYEFAVSPIINEDGNISGTTFFARDITIRKKSEEKIRDREAKLKAVIENTNDAIWSVDENGKITFSNTNYKAMYKATFGIDIHRGMSMFDPTRSKDHDKTFETFQQVMKGEQITFETESLIGGKNIIFETSINPIIMQNGNVTGATYYCRDITERKETELRIHKEEALYKNLIATMNDALVYTDNANIIQFANDRFYQLTGYTNEETINKLCIDNLLVKEDRHPVGTKRFSLEFGISGQFEVKLRKKSGEYIYVIANACPMVFDAGQHTLATFTDITLRKQSENKVKEINLELDQFAYVVSHDLKAPLRAISNLSSWIEEDIEDTISDETRQSLALLRGRVGRMEALINGILEYSRVGWKSAR